MFPPPISNSGACHLAVPAVVVLDELAKAALTAPVDSAIADSPKSAIHAVPNVVMRMLAYEKFNIIGHIEAEHTYAFQVTMHD